MIIDILFFIVTMIYFCHGSAVAITISLSSKMVENDHLGMDISIFLNLLIIIKLNLLLFLY